MAKKKATLDSIAKSIEDLAAMTKHGLDDVKLELREEIGFTRMELKTSIAKLNEKVRSEFSETNNRITYQREDIDRHSKRLKALELHTKIHQGR